MSAQKHTPGPWSIPHFVTAKSDRDCHCEYVLDEYHMGAICSVHFDDGKGNEGDQPELEEAKANARLIAAAPELLEALKDVLAAIGGGKKDCGHDYECTCPFDKAKAAIQKAEST